MEGNRRPATPHPLIHTHVTRSLMPANEPGRNPYTRVVPRIKVCGVTRLEDLDVLADAGVDSVGFNLVSRSPRFVSGQLLTALSRRAQELGLLRVAVVMDPSAKQLDEILSAAEFDIVQLHGSELPELLKSVASALPVIKAISWSGRESEMKLAEAWSCEPKLVAYLVDAYAPEQGGGTGKVARWDLLTPRPEALRTRPLILAGGITPANVADAVAATEPDGVDTASGVESAPGVKNSEKVVAFALGARNALGQDTGI